MSSICVNLWFPISGFIAEAKSGYRRSVTRFFIIHPLPTGAGPPADNTIYNIHRPLGHITNPPATNGSGLS